MQDLFLKLGLNIDFASVITIAALIWARVLAMVATLPFLFGRQVPRTVRIGVAFVLTIFLYPALAPAEPILIYQDLALLSALFLKEILFGLAIGFAGGMLFYGFEGAGWMIDNQRGVSLARILIPELGQQTSLSGQFLFQFSIVLFLTLGGHQLFLKAFFESYEVVPLLEFPKVGLELMPLLDQFAKLSGWVLFLSVQISAPVLITILIADIILGVANRFAPQINVWELGFNVRGYIGILILFLSILLVSKQVEKYTPETERQVRKVIELTMPPGRLPTETGETK